MWNLFRMENEMFQNEFNFRQALEQKKNAEREKKRLERERRDQARRSRVQPYQAASGGNGHVNHLVHQNARDEEIFRQSMQELAKRRSMRKRTYSFKGQ